MDESIPDIVKDIDCLQETKQYSVKLEHNWSINNIFNLITTKRPGDKIESEQFGYENNDDKLICNKCRETCTCNSTKPKPKLISTITSNEFNTSSQLALNTEIICNCFLSNALWRLEINRSLEDENAPNNVSIGLVLMHSMQTSNSLLEQISNLDAQLTHTHLLLKLKLFLFNAEMNDLFEKQTSEIRINLKCFFDSLFLACNSNQQSHQNGSSSKFVEKFTLEKFCQIKDLLHWLNKHNSNDFCLLSEFKLYAINQAQVDSSKLNKSRSKCSLNELSSTSTNQSILILNYKHAWIIKNWRHFLMQDSQLHTFMNESEIAAYLSNQTQTNQVKFVKFRSKLFSFLSKNSTNEFSVDHSRINNLLKNVKWKLQLYPNGYSQEFEQNLSLFVNFSQLTGDLTPFSSNTNKSSKSNQNSSKKIEETFYDANTNYGLILLIKSSSSQAVNQPIEINEDLTDLIDNTETFVKASFQISIMDSNGKRVDKCQSEKQLFELFGSWGYKEWLTVKDLNDSKEKYLTNNFSNLNLNCKIVLFYTLTTTRTNLTDLDNSLNLNSNSSNLSLIDSNTNTTNLFHFSSSSLVSSSSSSSLSSSICSHIKRTQSKKTSISTSNHPLDECNTLVYDLRRMLKKSEMFDVIVKAPHSLDTDSDLKTFKAHKLILAARSNVLEKMFSNEKSCAPFYVNIIDFDARTVELFLNYLYTDKLELNCKNLKLNENEDSDDSLNELVSTNTEPNLYIELFKIADKYSVHRLKQLSEAKLIKAIKSDTCVELLILAYLHNSPRLKLNCFKYLAANVSSIVTQSGWSLLEKNYPSLLAEAFRVLYFKQK